MLPGSQTTNESWKKRKKVGPEHCGGNFPGYLKNLLHNLDLRAWGHDCLFPFLDVPGCS